MKTLIAFPAKSGLKRGLTVLTPHQGHMPPGQQQLLATADFVCPPFGSPALHFARKGGADPTASARLPSTSDVLHLHTYYVAPREVDIFYCILHARPPICRDY